MSKKPPYAAISHDDLDWLHDPSFIDDPLSSTHNVPHGYVDVSSHGGGFETIASFDAALSEREISR